MPNGTMGRFREKTSTFLIRLISGLGRKQRPVIVPLSKSLGSPGPQTSLIFELPDELILCILSHVSPDSRLAGHYARLRIQYSMEINDYHQQRMRFLRSLSMTCRTMRLRLLPWIWERLEASPRRNWNTGEDFGGKLNAIADALHADMFLAASVKFMMVHLSWNGTVFPLFVKCLESLPNLHTLEIGSADDANATTPLKSALKRVKLPQIKTLIIPPAAHPLLQCCCGVEDVVCVVRYKSTSSDEFHGSLASNRNSKIKRLAIPLVLWGNPSRFVAACPKLTELTVIYPHPHDAQVAETGVLLDPIGTARSATLELVNACKALPDFDTLQIVHFPSVTPLPMCGCGRMRYGSLGLSMEQRKKALKEEVKGLRDLAIGCLEKSEAGCEDGVGRKKTTLRVIELSSDRPRLRSHLGSMKVEEFDV